MHELVENHGMCMVHSPFHEPVRLVMPRQELVLAGNVSPCTNTIHAVKTDISRNVLRI